MMSLISVLSIRSTEIGCMATATHLCDMGCARVCMCMGAAREGGSQRGRVPVAQVRGVLGRKAFLPNGNTMYPLPSYAYLWIRPLRIITPRNTLLPTSRTRKRCASFLRENAFSSQVCLFEKMHPSFEEDRALHKSCGMEQRSGPQRPARARPGINAMSLIARAAARACCGPA